MIAGLFKSEYDSRDFDAKNFLASGPTIPEEYDLSEHLSSVIDQGSDPYCSPITALTNLEWHSTLLSAKKVEFSKEFIYSRKTEAIGDDGMTPRDTLRILNKIGVPTTKEYREFRKDETKLLESASKNKISAYARIYDPDTLKKCIITYGPVYLGLPVYDFNSSEFWNGSSLVGYHAVPAVGWDTDSIIIKNSWGYNWGNGGYSNLKFPDLSKATEMWTIINL